MGQKCVHKGCGKTFTDENEQCVYHPGPPVFHEGQKGWKCCKPRVLTFDEFLAIPPCTTGKHSTVDDTPPPEAAVPAKAEETIPQPPQPVKKEPAVHPTIEQALPTPNPRLPQNPTTQSRATTPAPPPESESDDPEAPIPDNVTCRRRGCGANSNSVKSSSQHGKCVYHPGQPIFHEGSKGWTCCKRRVLEFDEFMKITGCKTRDRHCFIGKRKKKKSQSQADGNGAAASHVDGDDDDEEDEYEKLPTVRHDFYQTSSALHVSFYLKKIDKEISKVNFEQSGTQIQLALKTQDKKQYAALVPLYGSIDPVKSAFRILGTKLEMTLSKADGTGWPVLRSDESAAGMIIQTGSAGKA